MRPWKYQGLPFPFFNVKPIFEGDPDRMTGDHNNLNRWVIPHPFVRLRLSYARVFHRCLAVPIA